MTAQFPENEYFVRLLRALSPWLNQIVIVGGWAHRLYRLHPLSQRLEFSPLATFDADVAVPEKLVVGDEDIHTRLKANKFNEELLGGHRPPVSHYTLGENGRGFYAEFLTPLMGGTENRGRPTATVRIAGVTSQKLRYLELLLNAPWHVTVESSSGFPIKVPTTLQIPNAASYLAQKLPIQEKRESKDRAKDVVYVHDTIQTFGRSLARLQSEWIENVRPMLPAKAAAKVTNSSDKLFREITDTVRNASMEVGATGRSISPDEIRAVCYAGLKQVFV